ncbi:hypothetical protein AB733_04990 [Photobacterium swingsii]|uniref:hypothetical protein n=1 Tax=Photobacterium swingsii TaxID=680026 RepID=UPI000662AC0F|nr:hypothetical protein [Photobacterium swingsii]KMV31474.1 hypothetical protein AB733_04990 [Photobacterium swingsii]
MNLRRYFSDFPINDKNIGFLLLPMINTIPWRSSIVLDWKGTGLSDWRCDFFSEAAENIVSSFDLLFAAVNKNRGQLKLALPQTQLRVGSYYSFFCPLKRRLALIDKRNRKHQHDKQEIHPG